ncbi:MAG: hypothetical protein ACI9ES_003619 [Oceanospirillaceae bacterium]|jgi:hypothetical protein
MKLLIITMMLLLSSQAMATQYSIEIDVSKNEIEHAWRGPNNYAHFELKGVGVGVTVWQDNIGVRLAYVDGGNINTAGRYEHITINLKYIASLELLYKYQITNDLRIYAGISTSLIPVPMSWDGIDPKSHEATDSDNDEGYTIGMQHNLNKGLSIGWRFNHYSRIKSSPHDEWIKGHSIYLSYKL